MHSGNAPPATYVLQISNLLATPWRLHDFLAVKRAANGHMMAFYYYPGTFNFENEQYRVIFVNMDVTLTIDHNERDFIQACVAREKWAQKQLYEDYYGPLMGVCLRYAGNRDDALDILHEGFLKVYKNIKTYQPGTSLISWMRRIMVNTAIDYYRKQTRRRTEDIDEAYSIESYEPNVVSQMAADEILECIQQLSPAYRSVFNLYVIEGYSHKEIAEMLGITESTSRSNLVKARNKLRTMLTAAQVTYVK